MAAFIFGAGAILFLLFVQYLKEKLQSKSLLFNVASLLVVVGSTAFVMMSDIADSQNINLVGPIPHKIGIGLPNFKLMISNFGTFCSGSLMLVLIGYAEAVSIAEDEAWEEVLEVL